MDNIRQRMPEGYYTVHHSYDPEIMFESPVKARTIWAMTASSVSRQPDGEPTWSISYGYYYETCEKRGDAWLFTSRRWQRYFGVDSQAGSHGVAVTFPQMPVRGRDAFDHF